MVLGDSLPVGTDTSQASANDNVAQIDHRSGREESERRAWRGGDGMRRGDSWIQGSPGQAKHPRTAGA